MSRHGLGDATPAAARVAGRGRRDAPGRRSALVPLGAALAGVALALAARHGLVEPTELTAVCDAAPWRDWACALRTSTVQAFTHHRLGGAALALAALASVTRWRAATLAALAAAGAAVVLYSTELGALALLLGALVGVRPGAFAGAAR